MHSKRILIVLGHPSLSSYCSALADAYQEGAVSAGHSVRRLNLGQLAFDPILREGYRSSQGLEPDLVQAQEEIVWAEHLVFVYPIWWGSVPALLKGFLDRAIVPGFGFKYRAGSALWDKLLTGRTARLISTSDSPWWWSAFVLGNPALKMMKRTVLQYCGVSPVWATQLSSLRSSQPTQRSAWLRQITALGRAGR